jgi:hypothetical protein
MDGERATRQHAVRDVLAKTMKVAERTGFLENTFGNSTPIERSTSSVMSRATSFSSTSAGSVRLNEQRVR